MKVIYDAAPILNQLDNVVRPLFGKSLFVKGIALSKEERSALYRTVGSKSDLGFTFKVSRQPRHISVKGIRGYYEREDCVFRILAEEEQ